MTFKIIDLFAGPGGLGEGFASLNEGKTFNIAISAEMESSAHQTLTLRSFFRHVKNDSKALSGYYDFCNFEHAPHPRDLFPKAWAVATNEARQLTLGKPEDNAHLDEIITTCKLKEDETVLIGGPPCQAYSLVGRSRNMGKTDYVAEDDHRHFLYREYLRILHMTKPAVFVMENVKGILSSKVGNRLVFHDILRDLTDPGKALGKNNGIQYTIHSFVTPVSFKPGDDPAMIDPKKFIIHAERYGIPQARHRVILLGVREDMKYDGKHLLTETAQLTVSNAFEDIPRLRSKLGRDDSPEKWRATVAQLGHELAADAQNKEKTELAGRLISAAMNLTGNLDTGALRYAKHIMSTGSTNYEKWIHDNNIQVWLNHETRSHMLSDLGRYLYASVFAQQHGYSPKGHEEFPLKGLAPNHANWETGKFADRFRVQRYESPSTTVTSHISKDGHYFIHPDPTQCRSLTVREAARLQTFPDNYFFQGNRTQQYHQVGNAVPSLLANQIARVCAAILSGRST
ncbi:DNA cytosine methyltransferase [Sulfuriferula sp.]|uniref:DNA cytosine methyltransferase n=1 Tax=Sulfuriferula sp. TaxID=2025307 RepID=UPI002730DAA7|nr:DNA (cytosine-5-)-methyltransferase [Sulfuriferula sp.]MDP2026194.1 DNA (cytosine-5-)-methyltransferase [Sulfuriferula sp.]